MPCPANCLILSGPRYLQGARITFSRNEISSIPCFTQTQSPWATVLFRLWYILASSQHIKWFARPFELERWPFFEMSTSIAWCLSSLRCGIPFQKCSIYFECACFLLNALCGLSVLESVMSAHFSAETFAYLFQQPGMWYVLSVFVMHGPVLFVCHWFVTYHMLEQCFVCSWMSCLFSAECHV